MKKISLFVLTLCFVFSSSQAFALSAKDIQTQMKNRLPQVTKLKDTGIVGENNKGYLEFRGTAQQKTLVDAENKDRKIIYTAIAKKQGVSADLVGQRRALSIAQKGKKGQLYQKANGSWYTK